MGEREQLNLRIDSDRKTEWESYVENSPQYSSVSALIRASVAREMNPTPGQGTEAPNEEMKRIHDRLASIDERLTDMERSLEGTEQEMSRVAEAVEEDRALAEIAPEVFARLPSFDGSQEAFESFRRSPTDPETHEPVEGRGTIPRIADQAGFTREQVKKALDKLQRDTARVRSIDIEGRRHYWKEV